MKANQRRFLIYPVVAAVLGGLIWAGFIRESEADFMTLLSSAEAHAGMAAAIPAGAESEEGRALRERLIGESRTLMQRAETVEPGAIELAQLAAYVTAVEGRFADAAEQYHALQSHPDCSPEMRGPLAELEAKSWSNSGDFDKAIGALDGVSAPGVETPLSCRTLRIRLLWRAEEKASARREAVTLGQDSDAEASLAGACLLEGMGEWGAAEAAYQNTDAELREYRLARLKLRSGDTDTALELLQRALAHGGSTVHEALQGDRELWTQRTGNSLERFAPAAVPAAPAAGH